MKAGDLDQRVVIERRMQGQSPSGQPIDEWVSLGERWAAVEPLQGREYFAAAQIATAEVTARIRLRYFPGLLASDRVVHRGDVYDIQTVINPKSRNKETVLMCKLVQ